MDDLGMRSPIDLDKGRRQRASAAPFALVDRFPRNPSDQHLPYPINDAAGLLEVPVRHALEPHGEVDQPARCTTSRPRPPRPERISAAEEERPLWIGVWVGCVCCGWNKRWGWLVCWVTVRIH